MYQRIRSLCAPVERVRTPRRSSEEKTIPESPRSSSGPAVGAETSSVPIVTQSTGTIVKSESQWRKELTREEYFVLRGKGTEPANTGEYDKHYPKHGYYMCKACGLPLYSFGAKYDIENIPLIGRRRDRLIKNQIQNHGL